MDTRLIILIVFTITTVLCEDATNKCKKIDAPCGKNGKCVAECVTSTTEAPTKTTKPTTPGVGGGGRKRRETDPKCPLKCKGEHSGSNRLMFSLHIFLLALTTALFVVH